MPFGYSVIAATFTIFHKFIRRTICISARAKFIVVTHTFTLSAYRVFRLQLAATTTSLVLVATSGAEGQFTILCATSIRITQITAVTLLTFFKYAITASVLLKYLK
eukprot:NODE_218_length_14160_cov_0.274874.p8 type:complete len:106 gc:universal NODE_218_length_14160_cov_0.274874:4550-4867(+)